MSEFVFLPSFSLCYHNEKVRSNKFRTVINQKEKGKCRENENTYSCRNDKLCVCFRWKLNMSGRESLDDLAVQALDILIIIAIYGKVAEILYFLRNKNNLLAVSLF